MTKAFISYSHTDEKVKNKLHMHLAILRREGAIEAWHDKEIHVGADLDQAISLDLKSAAIFIAIVSPHYLSSNYCYEKEFLKALDLQAQGKLVIVPVIAEYCDWLNSPFRQMKAVPKDGKPIVEWTNDNAAYMNVISELRRVLDVLKVPARKSIDAQARRVKSKNYKVQRDFTQLDLINFKRDSFNSIKKFFGESIEEINTVDNIQAMLLDEREDSFSCLISNRSKIDSNGYITVFIPDGSMFGHADISYILAERQQKNTIQMDKIFNIRSDQYQLYWSIQDFFGSVERKSLTVKEISEKLWNAFIEQVGIRFEE